MESTGQSAPRSMASTTVRVSVWPVRMITEISSSAVPAAPSSDWTRSNGYARVWTD